VSDNGSPRGWRRNVIAFASASALSAIADGVLLVAFPLAAVATQATPLAVSTVAFAALLPWPLFSLQAGVLVDRLPLRRVMVTADAGRAVFLAFLGLLLLRIDNTVPLLCLAAFVTASAAVMFDNAASSMTTAIVDDDRLERTNSVLFGVQMIGKNLIGPPVGAAVLVLGAAAPYGLAGGAYLLSAVALFLLRPRALPRAEPGSPVWHRVMEGLRTLRERPALMLMTALVLSINLASGLVEGVMVLFATRELDLSGQAFAILLTAVAVGAMIGAAVASPIIRRVGARVVVITVFALASVAVTGLSLAQGFLSAAVAMVVIGAVVALWEINGVTVRQRLVPEGLLGRVSSVHRLLSTAGLPLGVLVGGSLAAVDLRLPLFVCAASLFAIFGLLVVLKDRSWIRSLPSPRVSTPDQLPAA
jgi:MFS family permease